MGHYLEVETWSRLALFNFFIDYTNLYLDTELDEADVLSQNKGGAP